MSKELENALNQVNEGRRGFLKKMLIGSAAVAVLPLMTSSVMAQDGGDAGKGDGKDGKGKKGKKGKKGDGKGDAPAGN
jgi:hypothetical protein